MPLSLSFVLIGFFLWVAENGATWLGAWQYPDQAAFWQLVHVGKWGSWALLVSLSFVLVAAVKRWEGTFYGDVGTIPAVTPADPSRPPDLDSAGEISPAESGRGLTPRVRYHPRSRSGGVGQRIRVRGASSSDRRPRSRAIRALITTANSPKIHHCAAYAPFRSRP